VTPKRLIAAVPLLALTAGLASASPDKQGGIFRVGMTGASVQIDPQLSYVTTGWWLEYATAAKLYNYPDKAGQAGALLRPEVASGFTVSRDGLTYTFRIRKGFRFSDGSPVTARNFAYAIRRAQNPTLNSPAQDFIGQLRSARTKGDTLLIRLITPDPSLLSKLAMPFFQATSTKLPFDQEVTGSYPSAGPYYYTHNEANVLTSIRRNPHWKGQRPRHLAGVDVHWNQSNDSLPSFDLMQPPADKVEALAARFGVNKTRFWVKPTSCVGYVGFNNEKGLFVANPAMRKAVSWALDRTAYVQAAGPYAGRPWTHLLSPITPGSVTAKKRQPYSPRPDLEKARSLAAGHFGDGKVAIAFRLSGTGPAQSQVVRRNLIDLGFDPANIQMNALPPADIYGPRPPLEWDLAVGVGQCTEVDAVTDLRDLLGLWHVSTYDAKLARIAKLKGKARLRALGNLDLEITKNSAPVAPMRTYDKLYFFSNRVDTRSLVYSPAYQDWSIPALSLK
jgi:ABC-type transport system substrate-binding protein